MADGAALVDWVRLERVSGPTAVDATYQQVLSGETSPRHVPVLSMRS